MTSLIFPDLNVWLALSVKIHLQHGSSWSWYRSLNQEKLAFCRFTQMGFLRLSTTRGACGDATLAQRAAWAAYDIWATQEDIVYLEEPHGLEAEFRYYADRTAPAPREWGDSYLIAFAKAAGVSLVRLIRD